MYRIDLLTALFFSIFSFSQEIKKDSTIIKDIYGVRFGVDVSNPIRTIFNSSRKSIEVVGDYRINRKIYAAAEIGFLDNNTEEDYINFTTTGQYIKLGANYNLYSNWLDMENEVYAGLRYGFSTFSQTLHNYTVFSDIALPELTNNEEIAYDGLNASWAELVFGMKVEVYDNIFLGASFSFKQMINNKHPENFQNFVVPGFDRVYLNNGGFGFNYTVSYRLPLYKKNKIKDKNLDKTEEKTPKK